MVQTDCTTQIEGSKAVWYVRLSRHTHTLGGRRETHHMHLDRACIAVNNQSDSPLVQHMLCGWWVTAVLSSAANNFWVLRVHTAHLCQVGRQASATGCALFPAQRLLIQHPQTHLHTYIVKGSVMLWHACTQETHTALQARRL
jgi:hypothetical protein